MKRHALDSETTSSSKDSARALEVLPQEANKRCCLPDRGACAALATAQQQGAEQQHSSIQSPWTIQQEATPAIMRTLVTWLLAVADDMQLLYETCALAVSMVQRYMAAQSIQAISQLELQLLGVTALWLAAKYDQAHAPPPGRFAAMTCNAHSVAEMVCMERRLLAALGFEIGRPTPMAFCSCLMVSTGIHSEHMEYIARHLLRITKMVPGPCDCFDVRHLSCRVNKPELAVHIASRTQPAAGEGGQPTATGTPEQAADQILKTHPHTCDASSDCSSGAPGKPSPFKRSPSPASPVSASNSACSSSSNIQLLVLSDESFSHSSSPYGLDIQALWPDTADQSAVTTLGALVDVPTQAPQGAPAAASQACSQGFAPCNSLQDAALTYSCPPASSAGGPSASGCTAPDPPYHPSMCQLWQDHVGCCAWCCVAAASAPVAAAAVLHATLALCQRQSNELLLQLSTIVRCREPEHIRAIAQAILIIQEQLLQMSELERTTEGSPAAVPR